MDKINKIQIDPARYLNVKSGQMNERSYFLDSEDHPTLEKINSSRKLVGMKPWTYVFLNMKVSHLKGFDLKWHVLQCEKSDNFSRCFLGRLKVLNK